jgi:hypothetical protein
MDLQVECLRCGARHALCRSPHRRLLERECPRCGYVGWAASADLREPTRRALRVRPVESRRLRLVA